MIELENVSKTYPDGTAAVQDLSLEIQDGEFSVFLGPSGCGKTTSMKMINRLIPMTGGRIIINGTDINQVNQNELRRDIGYAIQNIGLFPHLTVAQNIGTVPDLKKWSKSRQRDRAAELLHLVGMDPDVFLDRYPSELSGGQQQRVGVARCLGADPPILLMDEPFGAIDPITRVRLQDEFLKIQDKLKKTIAFVTHDINEAIKMGDKIALMRAGSLVQYDEPAKLLNEPKNEFVRNFVGSDRFLKGLRLYKARDVMQPVPLVLRVDQSPAEALKLMKDKGVSWAVLVDAHDHLLGWVLEEDLGDRKPLEEIYEPAAATADPLTAVNEVLSMMFSSALGNLAIVDDDGKLQGIVSFEAIREVLGQQDGRSV